MLCDTEYVVWCWICCVTGLFYNRPKFLLVAVSTTNIRDSNFRSVGQDVLENHKILAILGCFEISNLLKISENPQLWVLQTLERAILDLKKN